MPICPTCPYATQNEPSEYVNFHTDNQNLGAQSKPSQDDHWACKPCADIWNSLNECPKCRDFIATTSSQSPSLVESQMLSHALRLIFNRNITVEKAQQYYPSIRNFNDKNLLQKASTGGPYRVPEGTLDLFRNRLKFPIMNS